MKLFLSLFNKYLYFSAKFIHNCDRFFKRFELYKYFLLLLFCLPLFADQTYCFTNNINKEVCVANKIIIKTDSQDALTKIINKYGVHYLKTLSPNLYLLQTSDAKQVPKIASEIAQETGVVYAQPDYVKKHLSR